MPRWAVEEGSAAIGSRQSAKEGHFVGGRGKGLRTRKGRLAGRYANDQGVLFGDPLGCCGSAATGATAPTGAPLIPSRQIEQIAGELKIEPDAARELLLHASRGDRAKVRAEVDRLSPPEMTAQWPDTVGVRMVRFTRG